jgi:BASS family bile acid:Na+ symporter
MRQIGQVTFLPVIIGLLIQRWAPKLGGVIAKPVQKIANVLFVLLLVLIVVILAIAPNLRAMLNLGGMPLAAILIMAAAALAIGHLMGGPPRQQRSTLATACIARNVGLALYIAGLCDYGQQIIPTLLTYMIAGAVLALPYGVWSKRQMR